MCLRRHKKACPQRVTKCDLGQSSRQKDVEIPSQWPHELLELGGNWKGARVDGHGVSKNVAKVDVKQKTCQGVLKNKIIRTVMLPDDDVVAVSVPHSQYVTAYEGPCCRSNQINLSQLFCFSLQIDQVVRAQLLHVLDLTQRHTAHHELNKPHNWGSWDYSIFQGLTHIPKREPRTTPGRAYHRC